MKRSVILLIFGIIATIASQAFWLASMYRQYQKDISLKLSSHFDIAIEKELGTRIGSKYGGEKIEVTAKEAIPPEKLHEYKGDTIKIDDNIGKGLSNIVGQVMQELKISHSVFLDVHKLDSIYATELKKDSIATSVLFTLYNKEGQAIACSGDSIDFVEKNREFIIERRPIGTKGNQTLEMKAEIPPKIVLEKMKIALIISGFAMMIVLACLVYQLAVIRKKNKLLAQREQAVNGTIHDLKSPLAGIYSLLQYFSMHETDGIKIEMLQKARTRIKKLNETIEALLSSTRESKQKINLILQEVNLPDLLNQVMEDMRIRFPEKHFSLEINNQLPASTIYADEICINSVFTNLIENALKYSDEDVKISVTLTPFSKGINIVIEDTGWGIPRQAQKNIFKMFYQVPRKQIIKGYGIGLSYVRRIVREHGGNITFTSQEGQGTAFHIHLPNLK